MPMPGIRYCDQAQIFSLVQTHLLSPPTHFGVFSQRFREVQLGNEAPRSAWTPHQRIKLKEALAAYYPQPHLTDKPDFKTGRLQAGFTADLVVLPNDLFSMPEEEIASIMPTATMVNGEWVFMSSFEIR